MEQISIIICSRKKYIDKDLLENIEKTVGCSYELIVINNSENKHSIFEAYNIGIERSNYNYLCFIHDDVCFNTQNWGERVLCLFDRHPEMGLLGIAGGKNKTRMPSGWWEGGSNHLNILQHYKDKPKERWEKGFHNSELIEVSAIDGVIMIMRADSRIRFDERLRGFHNYDLFLSIKNKMLGKKVMVTNSILLEHYSPGSLNKEWYVSTSVFHKLYSPVLPYFLDHSLPRKSVKKVEFRVGVNFVNGLLKNNLKIEALYWWVKLLKLKPLSKYHFHFLRQLIKN